MGGSRLLGVDDWPDPGERHQSLEPLGPCALQQVSAGVRLLVVERWQLSLVEGLD